MRESIFEVYVTRSFEAAHQLSSLPFEHKCHGIHGHHYKVTVVCSGDLDPDTGFVIDFADIKAELDPLIELVDHSMLNDVLGLTDPTAENIAAWFGGRLCIGLGDSLCRIEISETDSSGCIYRCK